MAPVVEFGNVGALPNMFAPQQHYPTSVGPVVRTADFEYTSSNMNSNSPDTKTIGKVIILVSIFGWVFLGTVCIMCINGRGRAGRLVPEWYLDECGSTGSKIAVGLWWLLVILLWPILLPVVLIARGYEWAYKTRHSWKPKDEKVKTERDGFEAAAPIEEAVVG